MSRWVLVSNRLPFNINTTTGKVDRGSGGLVTALMGLENSVPKIWAGSLTGRDEADLIRAEAKNLGFESLLPVLLTEELYDAYYNGFANDVLWPLMHYESSMVHFRKEKWEAYVRVNEIFAENLLKELRDDDRVWIHDFHLCLLPRFLKKAKPLLKVGFFLHIPWPSSEIFRQLPVRNEILEGLLGADLLGFHDSSYVRHFSSGVEVLLGYDSDLHHIHADHDVRLGVFPVGVDVKKHFDAVGTSRVREILAKQESAKGPVQILGVDRLDYSKGLDLKLEIFRQLLRDNPDLAGKIQLVQIAIPTRQGVPEYVALKRRVDQLVGEINGEFSRPGYTAVNYVFSSVDFDELTALYRGSHALLVTSTRDGMNLVAMEYLASQNLEDPGVLLLSEFTGASSLLSSSLPINPWNIQGSALMLKRALDMPIEERRDRHGQMMKFLKGYTTVEWGRGFMHTLDQSHAVAATRVRTLTDDAKKNWGLPSELVAKIRTQKLILVFDYDGTLVPIAPTPNLAVLPQRAHDFLGSISKNANVEVHIVSGRDREFLDSQVAGLGLHRAAEHGAEQCGAQEKIWHVPSSVRRARWYVMTAQIMQELADRVPGSFVEKKSRGLVWHYRNSPSSFAGYQARKLLTDLKQGLSNYPVSVTAGKKVIEVRSQEANKGIFISKLKELHDGDSSMFLVFGDDQTDEDMFEALQFDSALTIKVGKGPSRAKWRLPKQEDVLPFVEWISRLRGISPTQPVQKIPEARG